MSGRGSPEALRAHLLPGYVLTAEMFGADAEGKGGFSVAVGHDLIAWLAGHGWKVCSAGVEAA